MSESNNEVRGHLCEGLKRFQENSTYSCIPKFNKEGEVEGCDATNEIRIIFCPFCGEKLIESKEYKYTCVECKDTWKSYDKNIICCDECYSGDLTIEVI